MNQRQPQTTESWKKSRESTRKPIRNEVQYGKVPPQARDLEEAVIGAILLEKDKREEVMEILHSIECFYVEAHQRIYAAIRQLVSSGSVVDLLTVTEQLRRQDELELIGGAYYLTKLTMGVITSAHAVAHARIVMEKFMQRQIITHCSDAIASAYAEKTDVFDLIEQLEKSVYDLSIQNAGSELHGIAQDLIEVCDDIEYKRTHQVTFTGIPTGFQHLDDLTGGWQKSDLIILAARPSVGKTAFALNLAMNAATSKSRPTAVAVFSLEMGRRQLTTRLISLKTEVPLKKIKSPTTLESAEVNGIYRYTGELGSAPIFLDDTAGITVTQIKGKVRRLMQKMNKRSRSRISGNAATGGNQPEDLLVIIDYLQLMQGSEKVGNREQEISKISRDLKIMAKELDIPVIALSQLSRAVESRADKRPVLADLRESGAIEQDADLVALMYRPLKEDIAKMPELANANYLDIAKHRNGELDAMPLYKDLSIQKFSDEVLIQPFQFINSGQGKLGSGYIPLEEPKEEDFNPDNLPF